MLIYIGWFCVVAGGCGIAYFALRRQGPVPQTSPSFDSSFGDPVSMSAWAAERREEQLERVDAGAVIISIDGSEVAVRSNITLLEMTQRNGAPWEHTGKEYRGLYLANDSMILKVPAADGGEPVWLIGEPLKPDFSLERFFKGTKENPGPAKQFRENGQQERVPFELKGNLTPGITWEVVDIGCFDAEVEHDCSVIRDNDRLYFVLSEEQGGDRRLLYLDARKGEAMGQGGLFLCEPFNPPVDVAGLI